MVSRCKQSLTDLLRWHTIEIIIQGIVFEGRAIQVCSACSGWPVTCTVPGTLDSVLCTVCCTLCTLQGHVLCSMFRMAGDVYGTWDLQGIQLTLLTREKIGSYKVPASFSTCISIHGT